MLFLIVIYIFFCLLIWHQLRITYKYKNKCINDIESINSRFFLFLFLILSNFFRLIFFLYIYFFYYYDYVLIIDLHKPISHDIKLFDSFAKSNLHNKDFANNLFINNIHNNKNLLKFLKKENYFNIKNVEKDCLNLVNDIEKENKEMFDIILNEKKNINTNDKPYKKNNDHNFLRKMQNTEINDLNELLEEKEIYQLVRDNNNMYSENIYKEKNSNLGNEYNLFKNKDLNENQIKKNKLNIKYIPADSSKKNGNSLDDFINKNLNEINWDHHMENERFQYDNSLIGNKYMKNSLLKHPSFGNMNKLIKNAFEISEEKKNSEINNKENNKIYSKINNGIITEKKINKENSTFDDLKINEDNTYNEPLNKKSNIININENKNCSENNEIKKFSEQFVHSIEKNDIYVEDNITKKNNNKILNGEKSNNMNILKNKVCNNIKELKDENTNKDIVSAYSINSIKENGNNKSEHENYILTDINKKNKGSSDKNELLIRIHKSNEKNLLLWIYLFLNFLPSLFYINAYSIILSIIIKVYYIFILKSDTIFKQALFYGNVLLYFLFISITCFTFVTSIYLYKAYVLILLTIYYIILAILLCYFGNRLLIHLNLRNKYYGIKDIDTYIVPLRHKKDSMKKSKKYKLKTTNNIKNYFYKIQEKIFNRRIHEKARKDLELNIFILVSFISFMLILNSIFNVYMAYHIIRTYMNYNYIKKIHIYLYIYLISEFIPNICIFLTSWTNKIDKSRFSNNSINFFYHLNNTINKNRTTYEENYEIKNMKHLLNDDVNNNIYEEFHSN
ncbi:hypothetical protein PGAL8A_00481500 [Plasmodium gallinaceum]|uniref:Uncharacterized protein n=1 Tax=Plasmodium gallinaceum TaxID=5849 RepID=A0A1J1GXQ2_PLAGA|nr:hypothetical protein PGAL8A_00481500 [Plasmodium gallinaceum]CRG97236.1 hypothetical protein PGAL8A_00481500 [Plasmodium gallinaceum]